jgi:hypothetical protein
MVPLAEDDTISVTVYISRHEESDNIHLTPSIYLSAQKYKVHGIKTVEEVKQLLMVNRFQLAEIRLELDDLYIAIDCVASEIKQSGSMKVRPFTMEKLTTLGLFGYETVRRIIDEIT